MASSRFASLEGSIQTFIEEQGDHNTVKTTKRDLPFLTEFLQRKRETRSEIAEVPPAELNELLSEFILSVRTKDGQDYEPSSVRSLLSQKSINRRESEYPATSKMTKLCTV